MIDVSILCLRPPDVSKLQCVYCDALLSCYAALLLSKSTILKALLKHKMHAILIVNNDRGECGMISARSVSGICSGNLKEWSPAGYFDLVI